MENLSRRRSLIVPVSGIGLMAVLLIGAVATQDHWRTRRAQHAALESVTTELSHVSDALKAAIDSTSNQIRLAQHVMGWMAQEEDGGSAELVAALTGLKKRADGPIALTAMAALGADGKLGAVGDAATRRRLIALDRRLAAAALIGEPAFEHYRVRLEEALTPGMWRFIFYDESGKYPVDFKGTLRELTHSNFDRTLRSLLRGLTERRVELEALAAETSSLRRALEQTANSTQP